MSCTQVDGAVCLQLYLQFVFCSVTCLFNTKCFPFQYFSICSDCNVLTISTGFTAVSWLISKQNQIVQNLCYNYLQRTLWKKAHASLLLVLFRFTLDDCPALTLDGDLFALEVVHVAQQDFLPVAAVADEPQVRKRPFRRSHLLLHLGQQITYSKCKGGGVRKDRHAKKF